jgi:metallo-beta-lactamase family protein
MAQLTFLGAAGCVTGSKHLVAAAGRRLLVDCGLFQGGHELKDRNWQPLPVDPKTIDWVVLTHAHLDHTGWLPRLVHGGFNGPIFADSATTELVEILLRDSAHLQEEDAEHAARGQYTRHAVPLPLYTREDIDPVLRLLKTIPRAGPFTISPEFSLRSFDAGHILGSASLELAINENGRRVVVVFSGDIGPYSQPILKPPQTPPQADFVLCESTYGDREHPGGSPLDALAEIVNRVAQRGGSIVIPSFAVGRTQTLMYLLRQLEDYHRIPHLPVYIDSPMALSATDLYLRHREDHDVEFAREEDSGNGDPLNTHEFHLTRTPEESKQINKVTAPCTILSASGMATGGRILFHLARRLPDPRNAVVLAGFQAEGTRGRALLEGARMLRIHGQEVPVRAEVVEMGQLSAHAGKSELLRWLGGFTNPPRKTFLVHGEPAATSALKASIESALKWNVSIAAYLQTVDLSA